MYEMIKYQLNITLYEQISLYSIHFDISLSQACCSGITEMPFKVTEMPNGKMFLVPAAVLSKTWWPGPDNVIK